MKLLFPLCFFFCFFLLACGGKKESGTVEMPKHLLSQAQMIGVLSEVHLLEAAINLQNTQNLTLHKNDTLAYSDLFKKYKTSYTEFQESFRYYSSKPEQLSLIYEGVINLLTRRQAEEDLRK
ncbi:MAG: DUF4296 domain-containing protein [Bacteroidia bacterium]